MGSLPAQFRLVSLAVERWKPVSATIAPFETRKTVQIDSKRIIAQKAVQLIQKDQVVIIDGGTTTAEMVKLLPQNLAFTVVMVSQEKMNSASASAIGELSLVSTLIVDGEPDAEMCQLLAEHISLL